MGGGSSTPVDPTQQSTLDNIFDEFDESGKKKDGDDKREVEFKHSIKYSAELMEEIEEKIQDKTTEIILEEYEFYSCF